MYAAKKAVNWSFEEIYFNIIPVIKTDRKSWKPTSGIFPYKALFCLVPVIE
jgi:hypothetical protein